MTSSSHTSSVEPSVEAGNSETRAEPPATQNRDRVFLMTDSLETGGSERQFAALAGALNRDSFSVHLGCLQRKGRFLDSLGDVIEFPLGGSLYGVASLRARWRLSRYFKRHEIGIAHAFDFYSNLVL